MVPLQGISIYIYLLRERERERERYQTVFISSSSTGSKAPTQVEDVNCMLRSQTSQNLRARMLTFSDPRDFNKLKLGVKQLLPQHCAEFSSAQTPS